MKPILILFFVLISSVLSAQKLLLIDKRLTLPLKYSNTFTTQDNLSGYFPVENAVNGKFITEVENIIKLLENKEIKKPDTYNLTVGSTTFQGIRVLLAREERMDIVITTNVNGTKTSMHLCDAKISNASNAFFINTWLRYIKGGLK